MSEKTEVKLEAKNIQKLQRDNNKLLIAGLFIVLFAGWCVGYVYLISSGILESAAEGGILGTITGALIAILKDIYQFFFRKSGTEIEDVSK